MLEADGERVIPDLQREQLVYAEHVARYRFAAQLAKGKRILDAACGEGYGAAMLRDAGAASVVGIDNARSVVEHARERYGIEAVEGDVRELPFDDASFDLVVSFETIEHVPDPEKAIAEFRRVLAQDGRLVISTPNRDEYLVENEFHELELTPDEFLELLSSEFSEQLRLYQQNWLVSAVVDESTLRSHDPDSPLPVTLGKAVDGEPGQELFSVVVCGPPSADVDAVAVATGIYEAQRMAVEIARAHEQAAHAQAQTSEAEARRAESEREQTAWQERALEAERQRAEFERDVAAWQGRALEAEDQREAWQARALEAERQREAWHERASESEAQVAAWQRRTLESENEREEARNTIRRMESSKSWRLTRPLRRSGSVVRGWTSDAPMPDASSVGEPPRVPDTTAEQSPDTATVAHSESLDELAAATSDDRLAGALASSGNTDEIREALCLVLTGSGYEIGAADRPTRLPEGCSVTYVDRFTYEEAAEGSFIGKSPEHFVDVAIYEPLEKLDSIRDETADFFVACHVIEHVADVVGAFREMHRKLRANGRIVLVVPDSRFIFDSGRPVTTLEHFIADDLQPSASDLDHYLEYFRRAAQEANWIDVAVEGHRRGRDIHAHVFTPESMRELVSYVQAEVGFSDAEVLEPAHVAEVAELFVRMTK